MKYAAVTRDEGNAVDGRFPTASSVKNEKREPGIKTGCEDGKLVGIDENSHKNKEYTTYD